MTFKTLILSCGIAIDYHNVLNETHQFEDPGTLRVKRRCSTVKSVSPSLTDWIYHAPPVFLLNLVWVGAFCPGIIPYLALHFIKGTCCNKRMLRFVQR